MLRQPHHKAAELLDGASDPPTNRLYEWGGLFQLVEVGHQPSFACITEAVKALKQIRFVVVIGIKIRSRQIKLGSDAFDQLRGWNALTKLIAIHPGTRRSRLKPDSYPQLFLR